MAFCAVVAAGYGVSCWLWPLTACTKCEGTGRWSRSDGKVWADCRRCKGAGKRIRAGRRVANWWLARYRETR